MDRWIDKAVLLVCEGRENLNVVDNRMCCWLNGVVVKSCEIRLKNHTMLLDAEYRKERGRGADLGVFYKSRTSIRALQPSFLFPLTPTAIQHLILGHHCGTCKQASIALLVILGV
jgi:hypothetical protein